MNSKILLIVLIVTAIAGYAAAQVLDVPQKYQKYNQWCWAACSEATLSYYGTSVSQETIAQEGTHGVNTWNWLWGITDNPYRKGIKELLAHWNVSGGAISNKLSQSSLQSQIGNRRPVIVRWGWDSGGGHFVICRGLQSDTAYIMDPWSGPTINTYNWLCRGSSHTWTHSLTTSK